MAKGSKAQFLIQATRPSVIESFRFDAKWPPLIEISIYSISSLYNLQSDLLLLKIMLSGSLASVINNKNITTT